MMEKREKVSKSILVIFLILLLFTLLQFLSPFYLPSNSFTDLDGLVGVEDNQDKIDQMPFPWNVAYLFGDRLCHQKQGRSFILNDNQMPFCSRCTAIWVGITIGLAAVLWYRFELNSFFLMIILFSLIPIGVDGIGQLIGFWESTNSTRVLTGLIVGLPVGISLGIIIDEIKILYKSKIN